MHANNCELNRAINYDDAQRKADDENVDSLPQIRRSGGIRKGKHRIGNDEGGTGIASINAVAKHMACKREIV